MSCAAPSTSSRAPVTSAPELPALARIGVLGGTFNPPHLGHLLCGQEALVGLGLDRILMVPAGAPPHKPVEADPGPAQRLALCRAAVRGDPRFQVSDIEMGRDGPSYTVDTLNALHESTPESELYLIVGGDAAAGFRSWHQPERVLDLATLAVANRRGTPRAAIEAALTGLPGADRTRFFAMPRIGISSTDIRARIRDRRPIRYLVPDAVASHIAENGLYQKVNPSR